MRNPDAAWNRPPGRGDGRWRRFGASLPMRSALLAVASVWILGCVWSYQEQSAFAASKGFTFPHLLPLVIDGFAVSMAGVAWAASLDARPAIPARLATVVAVGASSASNGVWAYLRAHHDLVTVMLGVAVPVAANLAFEVLLAELRRQVQRRRGLPPPVAVPYPRLVRIVLAPWRTFREWRAMVLELTAMDHATSRAGELYDPEPGIPAGVTAAAAARPIAETTFSHAETATAAPPRAVSPTGPAPATALPGAAAFAAPEPPLTNNGPHPNGRPTGQRVVTAVPIAATGPQSERSPATNGAGPGPAGPGRADADRTHADADRTHAEPPAGNQPSYTSTSRRGPLPADDTRSAGRSSEPANPRASVAPSASISTDRSSAGSTADPTSPARTASNSVTRAPAGAASQRPRVDARSEEESASRHALSRSRIAEKGQGPGDRPIDPRVLQLAQHLANADDPDEFTGEMVGRLLNIDVAPRTGRRLLGQARELVSQLARAEAEGLEYDPELTVIGGR